MKKISLFFSMFLCCFFAFSFVGCDSSSQMIILTPKNENTVKYAVSKKEDYTSPSTIYIDSLGEGVMPIIGFWGPWMESFYNGTYLPDLRTEEMYNKIAESGVNIVLQTNDDYSKNKEDVIKTLQLCENAGISYLVADVGLVNIQGSTTQDSSLVSSQEEFNNWVSELNNYGSFAGLMLKDEPFNSLFDSIGDAVDKFNNAMKKTNANKLVFVNGFPSGYVTKYLTCKPEDYYDGLVNKGHLDYIGYDLYPFEHNKEDDLNIGFYTNLALVYNSAKENNVPFMACVQLGGNWTNVTDLHSGTKPPTSEQVQWEVNNFIAFGAKGLDYFTLCNPHSFFQYLENDGQTGMFDPLGNKTKYYYAAKEVNEQILAIDDYLMNASHQGSIVVGNIMGKGKYQAGIIADGTFRQLKKVESNHALVGCFDYKGQTALYVVNNSYTEDTTVKLTFDDKYCYDVTQRASKTSVVCKELTLNLSTSESAFLILR